MAGVLGICLPIASVSGTFLVHLFSGNQLAMFLVLQIGHGNTGLTPWSALGDVEETVPELTGQNAITTYNRMRHDTQIASLLLAFTFPIGRYRWFVDPNGARDQVGKQWRRLNAMLDRYDATGKLGSAWGVKERLHRRHHRPLHRPL